MVTLLAYKQINLPGVQPKLLISVLLPNNIIVINCSYIKISVALHCAKKMQVSSLILQLGPVLFKKNDKLKGTYYASLAFSYL